ncbi:PEP-CTERM sorting domain-containing protein [Candidatus Poribacteria bacterium]|nr:PEP-CTERM sorting domain-containing protein [Candidatus Poribacteria bacterium]
MTQRHLQRFTFFFISFVWFLGIASVPAHALQIWETDYGSELTQLKGKDDATQHVSLSFEFPFFGQTYTDLFISTNGFVILGTDTIIRYTSIGTNGLRNAPVPLIAPFWTDLDLALRGAIFFNDFGDRAVMTWFEVGSYYNPRVPYTFQLQLFADGSMVCGYNGVWDIVKGLDEDLIIGWSGGIRTTWDGFLYEERSRAFDLDQSNVVWTPLADSSGFEVTVTPASSPIPEPSSLVLFSIGVLVLISLGWRHRRVSENR